MSDLVKRGMSAMWELATSPLWVDRAMFAYFLLMGVSVLFWLLMMASLFVALLR